MIFSCICDDDYVHYGTSMLGFLMLPSFKFDSCVVGDFGSIMLVCRDHYVHC